MSASSEPPNPHQFAEQEEKGKRFFVYWIVSGQRSYIGATVDPVKRLRQHCGIIAGGAAKTRGRQWHYKCVISGFQTWKQALQFEWASKYYSRKCRGLESRKQAIEGVMQRKRWTSNSPLSVDVPLAIEYDPVQYGNGDTFTHEIETKTISHTTATDYAPKTKRKGTKKTTSNFKRLHGVSY